MKNFIDFAAAANSISRRAGDNILLPGFRSPNKGIEQKGRANLVTEYDRRSEDYIKAEINKRFPGHLIVGEESGATGGKDEYVWFVDPLDATNNFAHCIPHFCVSIAVFSRGLGRVVAASVYEPVRRELFWAYLGGGAFLNGNRISVSSISDMGSSMLASGFPYGKEDERISNTVQVTEFLRHSQCMRRMGSAALDLCYVACGRFEGYWEPMLWPWDTAAGFLIVEEAGGVVSDYRGKAYNPEMVELVASNGKIHSRMLEILGSCTKEYPSDFASRRSFL